MRVRFELGEWEAERLRERLLRVAYEVLVEGRHVATGDMLASFHLREAYEDRGRGVLTLTFGFGDVAARVLHTGARPHWVPLRELKRWAEHKAVVFGPSIMSGEEAWAFARYMQKIIAERGNRAYGWLDSLRRELARMRVAGEGRVVAR